MTNDMTDAVAEIVTFRLNEDADRETFLADAKATGPLLGRTTGFLSRSLSEAEDGSWTDIVFWRTMDAAKLAAQTVPHHPDFAPFGSAIDGPSVAMRHERVFVSMT